MAISPALGATLKSVTSIGDCEQQQSYFKELHIISTLTYSFALLCWSLAVLLMQDIGHLQQPACLFNFSGMVCGVTLAYFSRTLKATLVSGAVSVIFISFAFRSLTGSVSDPSFWVLPLGLLITLTIAPLMIGALNYLSLSCATWFILGIGNFPSKIGLDDQHWPPLAIGACLIIGTTLNATSFRLRLKNYLAQEALEKLAYIDYLTGLNNRRRFTFFAQKIHQRTSPTPYFFLMLDIDDFKKINDTFGHDKGDEVLQKIAAVIAASASNHLCGRLGGEEFGIIFEGNDNAVRHFAMQLLRAVSKADVSVASISVSIGIAAFDADVSLDTCYRRADESLYVAKSSGKNQFHFASAV